MMSRFVQLATVAKIRDIDPVLRIEALNMHRKHGDISSAPLSIIKSARVALTKQVAGA